MTNDEIEVGDLVRLKCTDDVAMVVVSNDVAVYGTVRCVWLDAGQRVVEHSFPLCALESFR